MSLESHTDEYSSASGMCVYFSSRLDIVGGMVINGDAQNVPRAQVYWHGVRCQLVPDLGKKIQEVIDEKISLALERN
jgi:hypothetical protein